MHKEETIARKTTKTQTCDACNRSVPEGELFHEEETGRAVCGDCQAASGPPVFTETNTTALG